MTTGSIWHAPMHVCLFRRNYAVYISHLNRLHFNRQFSLKVIVSCSFLRLIRIFQSFLSSKCDFPKIIRCFWSFMCSITIINVPLHSKFVVCCLLTDCVIELFDYFFFRPALCLKLGASVWLTTCFVLSRGGWCVLNILWDS